MAKFIIFLVIVILILIYFKDEVKKLINPSSDKPDAFDYMTGKESINVLQRTREKVHSIDTQLYKQAVIQFQLSTGQTPENLEQLVDNGFLSHDNLKDPWGSRYKSDIRDNTLYIYSNGKDRIPDTEDDLIEEIPLR